MDGTPTHDEPYDVLIIGAGPGGLAVAARLRERHPSALFTDEEQSRYSWIARHASKASIKNKRTGRVHQAVKDEEPCCSKLNGQKPSILVLDESGPQWMTKWNRLFATFDIRHLRSPMFFHPDPRDRDALIAFAHSNNRDDELEEITGCVGRELSKHCRKKRRCKAGGHAQPTVTIDERDRKDYYTPSTSMFADFCSDCVERYGIQAQRTIVQATVKDIAYGYHPADDLLENRQLFTITTDAQTYRALVVVLAIGSGRPNIPAPFPANVSIGAVHAMALHRRKGRLLNPSLQASLRANRGQSDLLIIGGGLTSAQLADALIQEIQADACLNSRVQVHLMMRGPWKTKPFDVDLEWMAKFRNHRQAAFWSADTDQERLEYITAARNGGSITPRWTKKLRAHLPSGRLVVHEHTAITSQEYNSSTQQWSLTTACTANAPSTDGSGTSPPPTTVDYIFFATGATPDVTSLSPLDTVRKQHPIKVCGGLPALTDDLAWSEDVPLFVTGRLAALRLGPGAGNLEGARMGAERVAWAVHDRLQANAKEENADWVEDRRDSVVERYVAGIGSRYESLSMDGDDGVDDNF